VVFGFRPASGSGPGGGTGTGDGTGSATGAVVPDGNAPVARNFGVTARRFTVTGAPTLVDAGARRTPRGTSFRYTLSEAATSRITIARRTVGRRRGRRCVRATPRNRGARRCIRFVRAGTLTRRSQPAGRNTVRFSGRIGRRALRPARYRASLLATDAAGNRSRGVTVSFTVVRR
jgi:hypothetical protein